LALAKDPEVSVSRIVHLAEHDLALTAKVLRLANSSFFAASRPIASVRDAIVWLGLARVMDIILASLIAPLEARAIKGYDLGPSELFQHSAVVAVGVEALAREIQKPAPAYGFTAGLLHDVGKIVLTNFVDVDITAILDLAYTEGSSFEDAETSVLGINHAEAGALVLEYWNLPPEIVEVVRFHHNPDMAPNNSPAVDLVHVSDQLAMTSGIGAGVDGLHYRPCTSVISRIGLPPKSVERVLYQMVDGLESFNSLVGV
jgi:putative nucleotidyltransferase with HDIG domain